MEGLLGFGFCMWVCISFALPFLLERFSYYSEYYISRKCIVELMSVVEHGIGDEKHECVTWNELVR